jgi:crotonobetainyl-CoA:carnitine CoA-transferase CaiB-like acyl-CoA transferase
MGNVLSFLACASLPLASVAAFGTRSLWLALPLTAVLALVVLRRRRAAQRKALKTVPQKERVEIAPRVPGQGAPLMHGVRVVEFANTIAAPMASRVLAELGAEVIKVEPLDGDPWRQWLLNYEQPRSMGSSFEAANLGKSSVTADFTTAAGVKKLRDLLRDADVLITNTRPESLKRLGLTQDEVLRDFPHLVYASLSAWGHEGADSQLPGYDLGAFYAATGLATTIQQPEQANVYPTGFGDVVTSSVLVGAISIALRRRLVTGQGGPIKAALLRTAAFVMTPLLMVDSASEEQQRAEREQLVRENKSGPIMNGVDCGIGRAKPDYSARWEPHAFNNCYATKGSATAVAITVDVLDDAAVGAAERALREAFELDAVTTATLKKALADVDHGDVLSRLAAKRVPHSEMMRMADLIQFDKSTKASPIAASGGIVPRLPDVPDVPGWVQAPFSCHCSTDHKLRYGAPEVGAHNESVARKAWSDRLASAELPREATDSQAAAKLMRAALADVVVVELSSTALAAGAGVMFADAGATVHLIEDRSLLATSLRTREPLLFRNLARGKRSVAVSSLRSSGGTDAVHRLLSSAHVFLTDWSISQLSALGMDPRTLAATYPRLVVANATAFGVDGDPALPATELAAFWAASGLASTVSGSPIRNVAVPPPHFGELVTGLQLFAGVSAALFHLQRTSEGQRVDSSLLRAGLWGHSSVGLAVVPRDPPKLALFMADAEVRRKTFLVPTAHCLVTKDQIWVQLLGAELPRHFMRTVKALRVPKVAFFSKLAWLVLTKVVPSKSKHPIARLQPVLMEINRTFIDQFAQMTYAELVENFKRFDVWHTVIRMPRNFRAFEQAHVNGAFQLGQDGSFVISSPFDLGSLTPATAPAPALL